MNPLGPRPVSSSATASSQKACSRNGGAPKPAGPNRTISTPTMIPSTARNRVSRPARIAFSEIRITATASTSRPIWATPVMPTMKSLRSASRAAALVCSPEST